MIRFCFALAVCVWGPSWAQGANEKRPSEDDLFGPAPSAPVEAAKPSAPAPGSTSEDRDTQQMEAPRLTNRFDSNESSADPLKVGGTLYLRGFASMNLGDSFDKVHFSAPSLVDLYLDARPNERIRGMAVGRLTYDPTVSATAGSPFSSLSSLGAGTTASATAVAPSNPAVALDQLWLNFDIARTVFVTVGRQKVKWGVGRLWTPTDFLNATFRNPINPFDLRLGINAVKLHVPVESLGWNFYGYGLLDNAGPANMLGNLGGALRAEFVFPFVEIGLGGAWVKGRRPRYALDISAGLGPIDVYAETAIRDGRDFRMWRPTVALDSSNQLSASFDAYSLPSYALQTTVGARWSFNYTDRNTATIGAEYFNNPAGASSPLIYPWLILQGDYTPFYSGQHYLGIFATLPGLPGNLDWVTVLATNLLNLSDMSGLARLDVFLRVLSFLQVEFFASANYGTRGGEFRFGLDLPPIALPDGSVTAPLYVAPPVASVGMGLRISI